MHRMKQDCAAVCGGMLTAATIGVVALIGAANVGPQTPWGDPDLQGIWTSDDMRGVPRDRPDELGTRQFLTQEELARRVEQDQQTLRQQLRGPYGARNDLRSRTFGQTSLIVDPPDGKMPALTAEAQSRSTSRDS